MNELTLLRLGTDSVQVVGAPARQFSSLQQALETVQTDWVAFQRAPEAPGPLDALLERFRHWRGPQRDLPHIVLACAPGEQSDIPRWDCCAIQLAALREFESAGEAQLRPQDEAECRLWALLQAGHSHCWWPFKGLPAWQPGTPDWRADDSYSLRLDRWLNLLRGPQPHEWLRQAISQHLLHYLRTELKPGTPLISQRPEQLEPLRQRLANLARALGPASHAELTELYDEAAQALLAYADWPAPSPVWVDERNLRRGLLRLSYWIRSSESQEVWCLDGHRIEPHAHKTRSCKLFQRVQLYQRIVWLALPPQGRLTLARNGEATSLRILSRRHALDAAPSLDLARLPTELYRNLADRQRPLGWNRTGLKARLLRGLARLMSWRYRRAWLFTDREGDADDSAEHLYRWVRKHHPEINAWFVLDPGSADGRRLAAEGFRLVHPGLPARLLALNCEHLVSSHAGQYFSLAPEVHGERMRFSYHFVCHGVNKDDASNWLNAEPFASFFVASPAELESIVSDFSPYRYMRQDAFCLGLPRQDALLALAAKPSEVNKPPLLLFMPTWRASLFDERSGDLSKEERMSLVRASEFAHNWRLVLKHPGLLDWARQTGVRLGFMAHANLVPVLDALELPSEFEVFRAGQDRFQPLLVQCCGLVTDYTSVAFEFALLRRSVFYYQPDRAEFYGGAHNWRPGYFSYDDHGFGPVARDAEELLTALHAFGCEGLHPSSQYCERMERAMPDRNEAACAAVFRTILESSRPVGSAAAFNKQKHST